MKHRQQLCSLTNSCLQSVPASSSATRRTENRAGGGGAAQAGMASDRNSLTSDLYAEIGQSERKTIKQFNMHA